MAAHQAPLSLGFSRQEHGVGCHFLLQCMKVKSESEVAQSCLTLSDPMDCSPQGSSIHGIFQARVLEWGAIAFSETLFSILYLFSETSSPALHDLLGIASLNTQNTKRFKITMIEILLKQKYQRQELKGCLPLKGVRILLFFYAIIIILTISLTHDPSWLPGYQVHTSIKRVVETTEMFHFQLSRLSLKSFLKVKSSPFVYITLIRF